MATSLLALLDDITSILDDVAAMSKIAAKKTAGVLGDDLALNAEQVSGVSATRELPVVWAVTKGSFVNKLILVPLALLISAFAPSAIQYLMMIGGAYLCFEGVEKLLHKFLHPKTGAETAHPALKPITVASERDKIKGAIRTDFVLSAEIVVISLGSFPQQTIWAQIIALSGLAIAFTIGVYGIVAGIVKLDDLGLWLLRQRSRSLQIIGNGILWFAPWLMKSLSFLGTLAMFLVGGGIIAHAIPAMHHLQEWLTNSLTPLPAAKIWQVLADNSLLILFGMLVGSVCLLGWAVVSRIRLSKKLD